jgi:hypothetical protein
MTDDPTTSSGGTDLPEWQASATRYVATPSFVRTPEDSTRWSLCLEIANVLMGEDIASESVWYAGRALYHSDIPTN